MLFRSDRKSTRLNSSHLVISYAVFCLKKKNKASLTKSLEYKNVTHVPISTRRCASWHVSVLVRAFYVSCVSLLVLTFFFFFFFKTRPPPQIPPFPPPRPFSD